MSTGTAFHVSSFKTHFTPDTKELTIGILIGAVSTCALVIISNAVLNRTRAPILLIPLKEVERAISPPVSLPGGSFSIVRPLSSCSHLFTPDSYGQQPSPGSEENPSPRLQREEHFSPQTNRLRVPISVSGDPLPSLPSLDSDKSSTSSPPARPKSKDSTIAGEKPRSSPDCPPLPPLELSLPDPSTIVSSEGPLSLTHQRRKHREHVITTDPQGRVVPWRPFDLSLPPRPLRRIYSTSDLSRLVASVYEQAFENERKQRPPSRSTPIESLPSRDTPQPEEQKKKTESLLIRVYKSFITCLFGSARPSAVAIVFPEDHLVEAYLQGPHGVGYCDPSVLKKLIPSRIG